MAITSIVLVTQLVSVTMASIIFKDLNNAFLQQCSRVKFKEVNTIIALPQFETFASQESQIQKENTSYYEEKLFSWQEKVLSSAEIYHYSDLSKCGSEVEKKYNNVIAENEMSVNNHKNKLFSYVDEDKYNYDERITTDFKDQLHRLSKKIKVLHLGKNDEDNLIMEPYFKKYSPIINDVNLERMYVVVDMNNFESDPTFLLRREHVLFSLSWNPDNKCLTVFPDFNNIDINPYLLEVNYYSKQIFNYCIEHVVDDLDGAKIAEMELLDKIDLSQKQTYKSKIFRNFILPPKNVLKCLYNIEILSAHLFEYSNLYVEYTVELPYGFVSSDPLKGITQIANTKGVDKDAHFGHVFELCLNYQMDLVYENDVFTNEPEMYFEIISCDSWGRHRTEGYCYTKLPITLPGQRNMTLRAMRPQGGNQRLWELNRYFIGGRHVLNDLSWLGVPGTLEGKKLNKSGVKTISTGNLKIALNIILQSRNFTTNNKDKEESSAELTKPVTERLGADSLFKSVNTVLQAYKHAKEKLMSCQSSS